MKKQMLKKVEEFCKKYIICVAMYTLILSIGGYVNDSPEMKGAADISIVLSAVMCIYIKWRGRNGDSVDLNHEEYIKSFDEDHADLIKRRCMKLREEVKNKFADMGVEWNRNMYIDVSKNTFSDIIDLEALLLFDPEVDFDTTLMKDANVMLTVDKDADYDTNFKRALEAIGVFQFKYPLPPYKYVMCGARAKPMTEEEIMQKTLLREMGIEQ